MPKKTKKSRVYTAALGSLAGIATVASVASVIACGNGNKENAPSNQQIDTSNINFDSVKVFDNGEVQGLPQLPKGVHLDYFLDGQTRIVHDVHEFKELHAGSRIYLQLGADAGYALNGDLHKTSVLIDHHVTSAATEHRTIVQIRPEDKAPITVRQGEKPALPKIVGGTWGLDGGGTFVPTNYQPGDVVRFDLRAESEEYVVSEPVQLSVTVHGVITDDTFLSFAPGRVHILSNGQTTGLPLIPTGAHWHYAALITDKEIVLNNDGSFPADTALIAGDFVVIAVVADQNYEFSRTTPDVSGFIVEAPAFIAPAEPVQQ